MFGVNRVKFYATIAVIFFGFISILYVSISKEEKNVSDHHLISRGPGWKNNKSNYSGSQLAFTLSNSKSVTFEFATNSGATQGVEIFINEEKYVINSPFLEKQKLSIELDKNRSNNVVLKHFCTYYYHPCTVELKSILVDNGARVDSSVQKVKVLSVLGDSISTNYGNINYSYLLASALGYELHNASILSSTLSNRKDTNRLIRRYKNDLKDYKSNIIIIFIGSNDMVTDTTSDAFKNDYTKIIKDIKSWHPKATIFTVGILPRKDVSTETLIEYNDIIKTVANQSDVNFVDTSGWLTDYDFSDDLHPSIDSQEKMSQNFQREIRKVVK